MTLIPVMILAAIFALVLIFSLEALAVSGIFSGLSRLVVSVCVAGLSVLALTQMFGGQGQVPREGAPSSGGNSLVMGILLPYAALALSLLLILIIRIGQVCFRRMGLRRDREDRLVEDGRRKKPDRADSRLTKGRRHRE